MNNEIQQEQETEESKKTGNFWQDKAWPYLKELWDDKIKCLYILTFALQLFFLLLQFIPVMNMVTDVNASLFGGVKVEMEKLSLIGFCQEVPGVVVLFIFDLVLFALSLKCTATYFIRKHDKMKSGFALAKVATIFILIFYFIIIAIGSAVAAEVYEESSKYLGDVDKVFSLTAGGHLYWIVGLALLISLFVLSIKVKEAKEEERVAARVEDELKKKNEQEVA